MATKGIGAKRKCKTKKKIKWLVAIEVYVERVKKNECTIFLIRICSFKSHVYIEKRILTAE